MIRVSDLMLALARLLAGRGKSHWIDAIAAETRLVTSEFERLQWAAGAVRAGFRLGISQVTGKLAVHAILLVSATIAVEWHSGSAGLVLPVSGLATAALAFRFPGQVGVAVVALGAGLPLAHLAADLIPSLRPWYQYQPFGALDWAIVLFAFISCALIAAVVGVRARLVFDRLPARETRGGR